ncbi:Ankyrin-1 [Cercospora beticola]|uniref:Ankyrin-1 n=2 Tax=Cercospora beticola TaxID=122368 RepID=A0A2G5I815_CERBT|nr:Ankyrin-1 [Cercospora beticola]PIB00910.1 Ankyrin-1 [Cercospora beticola]CAK1354609.1 unnamed protein product [Cercospora beticola]
MAAASPSGSTTFFTPTTLCFTIACTVFSIVAISTVIRQNRTSAEGRNENVKDATPQRPKSRRRRAVDSLYVVNERSTAGDGDRYGRLAALVSLTGSVSQEAAALGAAELLGELSLLISVLCRLQQDVLARLDRITDTAGLAACFDAATSSIETSLVSASTAMREGTCSDSDAQQTSQQLKAQRGVLEFLVKQSETVPPTPPPENNLEEHLQSGCSTPSLLPSPAFDEHTGITPAVDYNCFVDPPPQYSPPRGTSSIVADQKADIKEESQSPAHTAEPFNADALFNAVNTNDFETLFELLSLGADPSATFGDLRRTPLHIAAHLNHVQSLAVLLKNGAELSTEDAKGDTALHLAAWAGNVEALSLLLTHSDEVDFLSGRDGYSALWCAISASQIDAARLLLKHGARVSLRSASGGGLLPLHQAAVTGQNAMCELLLDRGAQVDCLDDSENTPLHYAAAAGSVASVKVLLRAGADIESVQSYGLTAVHWAAHKGHADVLGVLLDHGANIDSKANEGATPLHLAANRGHVAAAKMLLSRGAERRPGSASWDGVEGTPAEMAKAKGHSRLVRLLRS